MADRDALVRQLLQLVQLVCVCVYPLGGFVRTGRLEL